MWRKKKPFDKYSKVRCALGMQRECCDPLFHSFFLCFDFFSCHFATESQCMKTQGGRSGAEVIYSIYQMVECNLTVLRRRSLTDFIQLETWGFARSKWWWFIAYWCIQRNWSICVYFSNVCDSRSRNASQSESFHDFCFLVSGSCNLTLSCLVTNMVQ